VPDFLCVGDKLLKSILFSAIILFASYLHAEDKGLAVLVPGTFNSVMPGSHVFDGPYYSEEIQNTLHSQGYQTTIIQNLNPLGNFEDNGKILASQVLEISKKYHGPVTMICHSAGGFYALSALQYLKNVSVTKVIMIATPLEGSEIADYVYNDPLFKIFLKKIVDLVSENYFDLSGLEELSTEKVKNFLAKVQVSDFTKFVAVAGVQKNPDRLLNANDSRYLSPALVKIGSYLSEYGDGLVSVPEALGQTVYLKTLSGRAKFIEVSPVTFPLDHIEQFLDYRFFKMLGFRNTDYIRQEQQKFYSHVDKL
jgi:hypothetical protein